MSKHWKTMEELPEWERDNLLFDSIKRVKLVNRWTDDHELCVGLKVWTIRPLVPHEIKVSFWWIDLDFLLLVSKAEISQQYRNKLQEKIKELWDFYGSELVEDGLDDGVLRLGDKMVEVEIIGENPHEKITEIDGSFWSPLGMQRGEIHVYYEDGTSEVFTKFEDVMKLPGYQAYMEATK